MASPDNGSHTPASGQESSPQDRSVDSSAPASRGGSRPPKEKHRVRFNQGGESIDTAKQKAPFDLRDDDTGAPAQGFASRLSPNGGAAATHVRQSSTSSLFLKPPVASNVASSSASAVPPKPSLPPKPSIMRTPSSASSDSDTGLEMPLTRVVTGRPKAKQSDEETPGTEKAQKEQNRTDNDDDDDDDDDDDKDEVGKSSPSRRLMNVQQDFLDL